MKKKKATRKGRMMKRPKPGSLVRSRKVNEHEVHLEYTGGFRPDVDKTLRALAKSHGGKDTGSGMCLFHDGARDIDFVFKTLDGAQSFRDDLPVEPGVKFYTVLSSREGSYAPYRIPDFSKMRRLGKRKKRKRAKSFKI